MVSGVLEHQQERVEQVFSEFKLNQVEQEEGWLVLVFERSGLAASE